jgi:ABC-type Na+ transport system ATPase subunit NatA
MDKRVKEQILAVRDSGRTNMFDSHMVQQIANEMDFFELVIYIEEHRKAYGHFILTGEED